MQKSIGFAGLGTMGSRMAANLLARGFPVTVWDRKNEAMQAAAERGAHPAASPEALAAASDVVVSIMWGDDASREVVLERMIPAARPDTTFIEMSTVSAAMQKSLAAAAGARGCKFLGVPVTGSLEAAAAGELTALVGGPEDVLAAQRDVLEAMTKTIVYAGGYGASAALKLGNNALLGAVVAALGESLRATDAAGVDRQLALGLFVGTVGRVANMKRQPIAERDFTPHFSLAALVKDLHLAREAAASGGLHLPLLQTVGALYDETFEAGKGDLDFSVIADAAPASPSAGTLTVKEHA